jgi:hypothetical protein
MDEAELKRWYDTFKEFSAQNEENGPAELEPRLERAFAEYIKGGLSSRGGMILALRAAVDFIEENGDLSLGSEHRLLMPLVHLGRALERLDDGMRHKLLQPQSPGREGGGSRLRDDEAEFRVLCAAATWMLTPELGDEAAKFVANRLTRLGFAQQRRTAAGNKEEISAKTIKNWQGSALKLYRQVLSSRTSSFRVQLFKHYWSLATAPQSRGTLDGHGPRPGNFILDAVIPLLFGHLRSPKD